ncbi:MAG: Uma2 family endonuclease [Verrucomicrobiae bacterium]|nr:Uma2 family endonuclease [Verrucomicrobiae bacterium]MCP5541056.1 Uma2 family endonuclease [Akkermansiaceae bacterium]
MSALVDSRRWTLEEYFALGEHGILKPDERTELIRGEIVVTPPPGPWHSGSVNRINHRLHRLVGDRAIVACQNPIVLGDDSAPEPDFVLLWPRDDFYSTGHPTPKDVILAIEIADSSYLFDRNVKAGLYAEFNVPEFWLVHRQRRSVTIFRDPADGRYTSEIEVKAGDSLAIPELDIAVSAADLGI